MKIRKDVLKSKLDQIYLRYNQPGFVDPDPLLFLYDYPDVHDREVAGIVASSLAYGRVTMIMKTLGEVLDRMGPSPYRFLMASDEGAIRRLFDGFRYRFARDTHLCALFLGVRSVLTEYGSLEACFSQACCNVQDVFAGLHGLYNHICRAGDVGHLLADPEKMSACKRSHLFLRWMVRHDPVDPGGWTSVSCRHLTCPVDTHMYKIGRLLGFTRRSQADKTCALEITRGFARICPEDPVRYDFALTRFGIRQQFDIEDLKGFLQGKVEI